MYCTIRPRLHCLPRDGVSGGSSVGIEGKRGEGKGWLMAYHRWIGAKNKTAGTDGVFVV